jgi:hypothetical protein
MRNSGPIDRRSVGVSGRGLRSARRVSARLAAALASAGLSIAWLPAGASADSCPNAAMRSGPSAQLPDCRAYEMVTPVYKNSNTVWFAAPNEDGSALVGESAAGFAGTTSNDGAERSAYRMRRTEGGWVTTPLNLPASSYTSYYLDGLNPSLIDWSADAGTTITAARAVWQPKNEVDYFVQHEDGSIADIGPLLPPNAPESNPASEMTDWAYADRAGVSADGTKIAFTLEHLFWPGDGTVPGGIQSLYEYVGTGNSVPLLVGVDNEGKQIGQCGTNLGRARIGPGIADEIEDSHNAMSRDGNTLFITVYSTSRCGLPAPPVDELFARIDNGMPDAHTVAISEPTAADCAACNTEEGVLANPEFEGASEDGKHVFFATSQPLLGGDTSRNLYEYDFTAPAGEKLIRVSTGDSTVSNPAAELQGHALQISEDGTHVYFVAHGALTADPNNAGESAVAGAENLYVYERDTEYPQGRLAFVADLCSGANMSGSAPDAHCPIFSGPDGETAVTPNGRFLVFASHAQLTPDDSSSAAQVFEYDAQTGRLVRVSVGQDGYNNNGNTSVSNAAIVDADYSKIYDLKGANVLNYWSKMTVSADGSYVVFTSSDALTPQATNYGDNAYHNVYEYHDGEVALVSDGVDPLQAEHGGVDLIGISPSGKDVFFKTSDKLVAQDTNEIQDIYDARMGGGFPAPPQSVDCTADACQGSLSAAPTLLSPGSEFQAGGNPPLSEGKALAKAKLRAKRKHRAKGKRRVKRAARRGSVHGKVGR